MTTQDKIWGMDMKNYRAYPNVKLRISTALAILFLAVGFIESLPILAVILALAGYYIAKPIFRLE